MSMNRLLATANKSKPIKQDILPGINLKLYNHLNNFSFIKKQNSTEIPSVEFVI